MRTKTIIVSFILVISLVAIPLAGCQTNEPPAALFVYLPSTPDIADFISFTDTSNDTDGDIVTWKWDFGDGKTSLEQHPTHNYAEAGTYTITLTVTDNKGASDTCTEVITVYGPPPPVDEWYEEIIEIAPEDASVAVLTETMSGPINITSVGDATFSSTDLRPGSDPDIVEIKDEELVTNQKVYFAFIDHQPGAFYAHPVSYVFIDPWTGSYAIVDTDWPPEINGYSMWDPQLGMGSLIEFWPVPDNPIPIDAIASQAPEADYGDAPDGLDAYHGVLGQFPTEFNTAHSHFGQPGGHTLTVGEEMLGLDVSAEVDATDPNDPDGVPNLVDADLDDTIYVIGGQNNAMLAFFVTVSPGAPDVPRYVNALVDFDYSGNWSDGAQGAEWVVVNMEVNVAPGESRLIVTPSFSWTNPPPSTSGPWVRLALTRSEIDESLYTNVGGWDGSGQYKFGEIEDHLIFSTSIPPRPGDTEDWPPPPPDGEPPPNGGGPPPPKPGPEKGPCGYDINYYVLIINCGDTAKHMGQGTPIAQAASSSVASAAQGQGYSSAGNLSPGGAGASETSLTNIGTAIANLAAKAKCGDHVLIYICGHGGKKSSKKPEGGISIYNSSGGKTGELLTPSALAGMLGDFEACDGQDCDTEGCCHVSVVIESCYAGNFNIPGLNDQENIVVSGSSTNTPAQGCIPGGGVYTAGFVSGLQNPDADADDPPNGVDPAEAHDSADAAVQNHPRSKKGNQQSWSEGDWCECVCPCSPGVDVEKWIWYEPLEMWVDEMEVGLGQPINFVIEIESVGTCRDIIDLEIIDTMDDCLEYADEAILYHNGLPLGHRPPDSMTPVAGGTQLSWDLSDDIDALPPGDVVAIEYFAYPIEPDININEVFVSAHCSYDYNNIVTDDDSVTVSVGAPPEDLLTGSLDVSNVECICDGGGCDSFFDVYCEVEALTGVVTYAALYVDGVQYAFWELNTPSFAQLVPEIPTDCDRQLVPVELVAMSLTSVEPVTVATAYVNTPPPPIQEEVLYGDLYVEYSCECDPQHWCLGCYVYAEFYAEDISQLLGPYPVTNVSLWVFQGKVFDSGPILDPYYSWFYEIPQAECDTTYNFTMVATNSIGLQVTVNRSITTPLICPQQ